MDWLSQPVGVVPVFVNVGVAIVPAIIAGLSSAVAVLLNPKELIRVFKEKPYIPVIIVVCGIGLYLAATYAMGGADKQHDAAGAVDQVKNPPSWVTAAEKVYEEQQKGINERWARQRRETSALQREVERLRQLLEAGEPVGNGDVSPPVANGDAGTPTVPNGAEDGDVAATGDGFYFRGGPRRTGFGGGDVPRELFAFWEVDEDDTMYLSSPAVVEGAVYGAWCYLDLMRNYGGVFRVDPDSGDVVWDTAAVTDPETGREVEFKGLFSSPAISADGKYLVIGQGLHLDADSELICLNTEDGSLNWLAPTPLHIEGSPAVEGDMVVAGAGAVEGPDGKPKGHPGFVLCVRISDGEELWRYPVADPESSPVLENGICYIGSGRNGKAVYALRTETDEQLAAEGLDRVIWKTDTPYPAFGTVTLTDELVLIGCGKGDFVYASADPVGIVLALDRNTGEERWRVEVPNAILGAIAVRDGRAVVPVRNGEVIAIDMETQEILWRARVHGDSPVMCSPAVTDKYVYATSTDGYLAVIDVEDGEVVETHYVNDEDTPGEMSLTVSSPFVVDGMLYVGSETGGLRCYTGEELE